MGRIWKVSVAVKLSTLSKSAVTSKNIKAFYDTDFWMTCNKQLVINKGLLQLPLVSTTIHPGKYLPMSHYKFSWHLLLTSPIGWEIIAPCMNVKLVNDAVQ